KGVTYVIVKRRGVDGFCHAMVRKNTLWIDMIAVEKSSQKRGNGTALLSRAERYGRSKGCSKASLFVDEVNTDAFSFYAQKGYELKQYMPSIRCYLLEKALK